MKIAVNRLPRNSEECAFSRGTLDGKGNICSLGNGCVRCSDVDACPYLFPFGSRPVGSMRVNDYQKAALRTVNPETYDELRIVEGVMGLAGESGECVDICKKAVFQGHDLDKEHLAKELGDVAWYLAVSADAIGYDLETIFRKNIEKLQERYPHGFDAENSVNRKEGDI